VNSYLSTIGLNDGLMVGRPTLGNLQGHPL